ncbi:MAG: FAD-dependent thymidylate synthase [Patescibacteria group bacterium]
MKVQHVSLIASEGAKKAKRYGLTPELLAATGARYSRSNEGLDTIVSKIDWKNTDKSVDGIFRMVDYGHASIADMAPVAMFIDGLSLFATHFLWAQCYTASGQESSTRYITMDLSGVKTAKELGIKNEKAYEKHIKEAFIHYEKATKIWTGLAKKNPSIMRIPKEVAEDMSERGIKKLERMRKNFALDRARIFLPLTLKKNAMLIMSARSWVEIISTLLSHPLTEFRDLGEKLKEQLELVTPRLIRHAVYKEDVAMILKHNLERTQASKLPKCKDDGAFFNMYEKKYTSLSSALESRVNRYSPCGDEVRKVPVNFGFKKITFAELHDLNRHRTGQKMSTFKPNDFYDTLDQAPDKKTASELKKLSKYGQKTLLTAQKMLEKGDPAYFYFTLVGHTYEFEHTTTLDKFIYEAELRTGVGAHYRYAQHLRNTLKILYKLHPEVKGLIKEGGAEPE